MAVKRPRNYTLRSREGESGQSLLEFILLLPVLVGLAVIMIRVNSAIQISIANQKHSAAHTIWYAFNSPYYPEKRFFADKPFNQMVIGVSDNLTSDEDGERYIPKASTQIIARSRQLAGRDPEPQTEAQPGNRAGIVRVRNTVTLCTQPNYFLDGAGARVPLVGGALREGVTPASFDYCGRVL